MNFFYSLRFCFLTLLVSGCSTNDSPNNNQLKGEYLYRRHNEYQFTVPQEELFSPKSYPWQEKNQAIVPISIYHFRCKGSILHPVHLLNKGQEKTPYWDCGGAHNHSLPLRNQKEFIYPILVDLLNETQNRLKSKVVITSGHCCPNHFAYNDPSQAHKLSKHTIGAEVDFYVEGFEYDPQKVVEILQSYYKTAPKYQGLKQFEEFQREQKPSWGHPGWLNKEIYIKVVEKNEGRDFDNSHSYPYINIQVRYDWDTQSNVSASWDKAFKSFYRY